MSFFATAWDIVRDEMSDAALKTVVRQGSEEAPGGGNTPGESTNPEHRKDNAHKNEEHEMEPITYFGDLLPLFLFLLAVWTAGRIVKATGGPALVGEIIAGCLLGPQLANYAPEHRGIVLVGDMALALLMVEAGLDIDVSLLSQVGPRGLAVAMTGTALPLGLGFGFGMAFGFSWRAALAAGCVLQPTSLAIVLGVLKSGGCLNTPSGQVIVAAAAIDDVIAVVLLSELRALNDLKILDLIIPVVSAVLLLVIVGFFAIAVVPPLLGKIILPRLPPQHTENVLLMIIFLLAIGLMSIADAVRSSYLLGALMAGLSFSTVHSVHHVWEGQVKRILKWLLKVFFASTIGFEIPIKAFWTLPILGKAAVFTICILAKLPVGLYSTPLVLPNFLIVGIAMCARGEFAFILALEAKTLGLLDEAQYASLVLPVLLAAVAAPFGLSASINFANRQGLANIDEAEDATSALNKAHNIYYQMHLRCKNSWGLVQGILHEATSRDLEVIDVRITTAGKDADDVFYFKDATLRAPIEASEDMPGSEEALQAVSDRIDELYEAFYAVAASSSRAQTGRRATIFERATARMSSAVAPGGNPGDVAQAKLAHDKRKGGDGDGDDDGDADGGAAVEDDGTGIYLSFVRWLPGLVTEDDLGDLDAEALDERAFQQITQQMGDRKESVAGARPGEPLGRPSFAEYAMRRGSNAGGRRGSTVTDGFRSSVEMGVQDRQSLAGRRQSNAQVSSIDRSRRSSVAQRVANSFGVDPHQARNEADRKIMEALAYSAAVSAAEAVLKNPHQGFSRFAVGTYERRASEVDGRNVRQAAHPRDFMMGMDM